jgi:DNA-binding beta-propeller fold protein YncE
VQNSLLPDNILAPELTAVPAIRQMLINLVFVSCPEIDTIFVVRTDNNWVVDSFGLKGGPTYLAIDPVDRNLLYVLASHDRMVKVVELSTFRVINFFPAPLNDNPTFMVTGPDGEDAFLLDEQNGYLTRINLTTGRIISRVLLGDRPIYAAYLEELNMLAVALSHSQKVLLLEPDSLRVIRSISTGNEPQGLIVLDNQLILAEYGDNTVSITDLSSRGNQNRLSVGFGPRRLLETGNQIYVSNYKDGSLSILVPGQFGVIQEIYGLGRPLEMAFDQSYFRLFVADEKKAALAVIDTNSNKLTGYIGLGARPFDLDVIQ